MSYKIRKANLKDSQTILDFIKELACYEKLGSHVTASIKDIRQTLFCDNPKAEVILLEKKNEPAGFALFYHTYSTFLGKYGIHLEDLFVKHEFRGHGFGKALLKEICHIAKERNCGRVEWICLDWNKPSIDFYQGLGAKPMSEWTIFRFNEDEIMQMTLNNGTKPTIK